MNPQTILKLTGTNILRLTAVQIEPSGSPVVVIGGVNGAGKSSVLNLISMAFGGKKFFPENPIHEGEKSGELTVETEDFNIRRTITPSGGTLTVSAKDGKKYSSPQQVLDGLLGSLSFDPLEFSRMKPKDRLETLKKLVGLDFTEEDSQRQELYESRTVKGRELDNAKARLVAMPEVTVVGTEEKSAATLSAELKAAQESNGSRARMVQKLEEARAAITHGRNDVEDLRKRLELAEAKLEQFVANAETAEAALEFITEIDTADLIEQISKVDAYNTTVRAAKERTRLFDEVKALEKDYDEYTAAINFLDHQKGEKIAAAQMPVPGLSLTDGDVTLDGQPLSQASTAHLIRASMAMGLALNPTLRVVLIRDGSLLDSNSLAAVTVMAAAAGAQVWIERVSEDGKGCTVVIEDGTVKVPVTDLNAHA